MVLLEQPLNAIRKEIDGFFSSRNTCADVDDVFPFVEIIKAGFEKDQNIGLNWLFDGMMNYLLKKKCSSILCLG